MSDVLLNMLAQHEANELAEELIKEYNSPEGQNLTQKGKRELVEQALFRAFLKGYKAGEGRK